MNKTEFQEFVWQKGRELYRDMPWRDEPTLYNVLVSELMLQQTQVARVLIKFNEFMATFPSIKELAEASLADVLRVWQGLGYNRRAKFLHEAAKQIVTSRKLPNTTEKLVALPGVGRNTAAAIMNYVYEAPTAYVETNIRTVYFQHFFNQKIDVADREILKLVEQTMDREHPREWFWALMDYGADLKSRGEGRLRMSKHYKKQSLLVGSRREMRGRIVTALAVRSRTKRELQHIVHADERFDTALEHLMNEGMIGVTGSMIHLTS